MTEMEERDRRRELEKHRMIITTGSWVRGVIVVAGAIALFLVRDLLMVLLASIVIASAVEPAAEWAKERRIPRLPTILAVYVILGLISAGLFYFLLLPLLGEASSFLTSFPEYSNALASDPTFSGVFSNVSGSLSAENIAGHISAVVTSLSQGAFSSASFVFGGVTSFLLIVILSFYLAVQEDGVGKFLQVITPWKHERYVVDLWRRSKAKIGRWMQGQLLLAAIIMVLVYLGLLLIGLPHALLLAVAAGFFEIIPLFGPILAAIPAILVGFGAGGMSEALLIAGLFLIIQQFENQLIYPLVVKKVVGVPPMVSIVALLVGGTLAGFLGVLVSVPVAAIFMEFVNDLEHQKITRMSAIGILDEK